MERRLSFSIDLSVIIVIAMVMALHALSLFFRLKTEAPLESFSEYHEQSFKIKDLRTVGAKDSIIQDKVLVSKDLAKKPSINPFSANSLLAQPAIKSATKKTVENPYRPTPRPKALTQILEKPESVTTVAARTQSGGAAAMAGSPTLNNSLMNMQVEIPEGVSLDELSEFELMFYGFQKRMLEKYVNSIVLNVRDYEKKYSLKRLVPEGKHVMTGRVTFDSEGHIKQIKMLRWTQADHLQVMFKDILKSMLTLPNPPKILRNPQGEFVVFYTLSVNNT